MSSRDWMEQMKHTDPLPRAVKTLVDIEEWLRTGRWSHPSDPSKHLRDVLTDIDPHRIFINNS